MTHCSSRAHKTQCCNRAGTKLLKHNCWNTDAGTQLLEYRCWNTTAGTQMLKHSAEIELKQKMKHSVVIELEHSAEIKLEHRC